MAVDPMLLFLARIALGLEQEVVAKAAGVSLRSLQRLEGDAETSATTIKTLRAVREELERRGVKFLGDSQDYGPGFLLPSGFPNHEGKVASKPLRIHKKAKRAKGGRRPKVSKTKRPSSSKKSTED